MSGGNSAGSRGSRAEGRAEGRRGGWEEAGGEFYQESYPGGGEDITTLLPSVQLRVATATMTVARCKRNDRRHSTNHATANRDALVSMLPDLSENLSNEETTWEEIMQIKAMPVPMAQKRERKAQLQSATKLRLQGLEQLHWKRRKVWQGTTQSLRDALAKLEPWRSSFKRIEGDFGTGVVAYFRFLKWLFFLNLIASLFILAFVIVPNVVILPPDRNESLSIDTVFDVVQGTGIMERLPFFYSVYSSDKTWPLYGNRTGDGENVVYYDLSLAYVLAVGAYFLVSLLAIVKNATAGLKERLVEGEGQFYRYCNVVFGGWDFCIRHEKSAAVKHRALYNEMKSQLEGERSVEERRTRSREERVKLTLARAFINVLVVAVLIAAASLIYWIFDYSTARLSHFDFDGIRRFALEYATSFTIVALNMLVPGVFNFLIGYEKYRPITVVKVTLFRTILLRFSSLIVLLTKLYTFIEGRTDDDDDDVQCWETYVGQQLYKLLIVDFAAQVCVTLLVNFPRSLLARNTTSKCLKAFGGQEFRLPKHVLDVVYFQTVCWLGAFYCPALPLFTTVLFFFVFYVKKFACVVNSTPPSVLYKAARSRSLFMAILLFSWCAAVIPLGYAVAEFAPSKGCGPFRNVSTVWERVTITFDESPDVVRDAFFFFGTSKFVVPVFIVLLLLLYYYWAVADANRHMVAVLKSQLVLEGHDKQFLLNRLSAFIRQQYKKNERARQQHHIPNNIEEHQEPPPAAMRHSSK